MPSYINAISYYLPNKILTNEEISQIYPEWSVEKISSKVGINQRHISGDNETAGDLAICAAEKLFEEYNIDRSLIDYVILCTQSPDYFLPSTSCALQHKLGLSRKCGAFDFNLGCSGYIYGLGLAKGLLSSNQAQNILLLTGETYTKYLNEKDKGNRTMFGDAATASLISNKIFPECLNAEILEFCYGTDGSGYENLIVKNGCSRHYLQDGLNMFDDDYNFVSNDNNLFMDGKAIFNFTAFQIPQLVKDTLAKNSISLEGVDKFIFHQANEYMLNTVRKRCGIPEEKFFVDIKDIGNTVSNSIPIAIYRALDQGVLNNIHHILISGFGVGLSMGAVLIRK